MTRSAVSWESRLGCLAAVSDAVPGELPPSAAGLVVENLGSGLPHGLLVTAFGADLYGEGTRLRLADDDTSGSHHQYPVFDDWAGESCGDAFDPQSLQHGNRRFPPDEHGNAAEQAGSRPSHVANLWCNPAEKQGRTGGAVEGIPRALNSALERQGSASDTAYQLAGHEPFC